MTTSTFTITLLLIAFVATSATSQSDYYIGFVEALGINTNNEDCSQAVAMAVSEFRMTLQQDYTDADLVIEGVLDIVDKLKYEVSPVCRAFVGDFGKFMNNYFGDAKSLINEAESNLNAHHFELSNEINFAIDTINVGQEYEAGKVHAEILRTFIGLGKTLEVVAEIEATEEAASEEESVGISSAHYQEYLRNLALQNAMNAALASDDESVSVQNQESDDNSVLNISSRLTLLKKRGDNKSQGFNVEESFTSDAYEGEYRNVEDL